jgi:CRP/FNR family transcriptional regulator, dissimilatory nitrate respiration regulator
MSFRWYHFRAQYAIFKKENLLDTSSFLAAVPLFDGLPDEQLRRLAGITLLKTVKRGEIIFTEGQEATGFYVAVRGRVKISKLAPEGKEQILHIMGFQEPFGEVPVFSGGKFPANAQAIEESLLVFFPRTAFVNLIREEPSLALNMLALLSRRLRRFANLIEELSLKEVPGRLASYLVYLSDRSKDADVVELDIPKTLLAQMLGTIPETVSRALAKMAADNLIRVEGRKITLLDRQRLEER